MDKYIENLIKVNNDSTSIIAYLESVIENMKIQNEKDKANFGNLCIVLKGFRMVNEGTECLLRNENIIKVNNKDFYAKIGENVKYNNNQEQHEQNSINNN